MFENLILYITRNFVLWACQFEAKFYILKLENKCEIPLVIN